MQMDDRQQSEADGQTGRLRAECQKVGLDMSGGPEAEAEDLCTLWIHHSGKNCQFKGSGLSLGTAEDECRGGTLSVTECCL